MLRQTWRQVFLRGRLPFPDLHDVRLGCLHPLLEWTSRFLLALHAIMVSRP
jgi:hypothetical protein